MAWIADLEEVLDLLGLRRNRCPKCIAGYEDLGGNQVGANPTPTRTGEDILKALRKLRTRFPKATTWQFSVKGRDLGLLGVENLCWEGLSVDICRVVCLDLLHGLHKYISDHPKAWITKTIGVAELDACFIAQPYRRGQRTFHNGISKISQWSGRENRDFQRHLAVTVAGAYEKGTGKESPRMMQATRSLLDFSYKAQFPVHSDITLESMIHDLKVYYSSVRVFIENGARCNGKGVPISHFRIPKHHNLCHFMDDIRDHGTLDNGSSEITEALHIPTCKVTYHATNRRGFTTQILDQLQRIDS
ncbi:uncharacterized protein EI90DRAFT_2904901, partial [Cantharellus anzutake]|uniref:uncharacterized protein n=1 Tax=Cantharellus anzutake TaxID=1750568 RepID=UPI001908CE89